MNVDSVDYGRVELRTYNRYKKIIVGRFVKDMERILTVPISRPRCIEARSPDGNLIGISANSVIRCRGHLLMVHDPICWIDDSPVCGENLSCITDSYYLTTLIKKIADKGPIVGHHGRWLEQWAKRVVRVDTANVGCNMIDEINLAELGVD